MTIIQTKQITLTRPTVELIGQMGLAFPQGSEERAAATLLVSKWVNAPESKPVLEAVAA